jgi:hypothetical protein
LDPGEKERGALESENCWEEEIKTKYIYIYRNWGLSQSLFDKKKKKKKNRHGQNKNRIAGNCKTKKEREHVRGILTT